MTCCNIIGCRGLMILFVMLSISALHAGVVVVSTKQLQYINREGVWIFFPLALVFGLLPVYFLLRWKKLTTSWLNRNYNTLYRRSDENNILRQMMTWYNGMFGVEKGKLYLWRLYIFEIVENWIQFSNMRSIYLCMLPLGWCVGIIFDIRLCLRIALLLTGVTMIY